MLSSAEGTSRWVVVDDGDESVSYDGVWTHLTTTGEDGGDEPNYYRSSLHGATGQGTSAMSFSFVGSRLRVYGVIERDPVHPGGKGSDPGVGGVDWEWECELDGRNVSEHTSRSRNLLPGRFNTILLCDTEGTDNGPNVRNDHSHNFTLRVKGRTSDHGTGLWIDYVQYAPWRSLGSDSSSELPSVSTSQLILAIEEFDPSIWFSDGWVRDALTGTIRTAEHGVEDTQGDQPSTIAASFKAKLHGLGLSMTSAKWTKANKHISWTESLSFLLSASTSPRTESFLKHPTHLLENIT
ncbi:hypothetical protein FA15DRAFT_495558 [Coprinopsis marcescibilis]|uniref:Uncharacterized protein n=1 Tax=Coprinopsis marcescibilis TaxID=230819 RepID=A0A5C3KR08_COPMA|nr:hypothetical protein FA15DRAFT_495558 [Coprinopsis marcescibilis]